MFTLVYCDKQVALKGIKQIRGSDTQHVCGFLKKETLAPIERPRPGLRKDLHPNHRQTAENESESGQDWMHAASKSVTSAGRGF